MTRRGETLSEIDLVGRFLHAPDTGQIQKRRTNLIEAVVFHVELIFLHNQISFYFLFMG